MMLPSLNRNEIAKVGNQRALETLTLDQLFDEAARYGKVTIFGSDSRAHPNCYKCNIEFYTQQHTKMEADSPRNLTVRESLIAATTNAKKMVDLAKSLESTQ